MTAVPISSSLVQRSGPDMAAIPTTGGTGLKVPSPVRFDKLVTLDRSVIAGKIGAASADWLHAHRVVFFGVLGFSQPSTVLLASEPRYAIRSCPSSGVNELERLCR
jgi:hypothetical protein